MLANASTFQAMRDFGAAYLLCLAFKSARSAFRPGTVKVGYLRLRRGFETLFAVAFGTAGVNILTARIE